MVRKGRVALATGLVGLAALTGGYFLMPKDYLPDEKMFPRQHVEQLVVNLDDSVITYAERTPVQATDDMLNAVYGSELEEAWVEIYKKGNGPRPFFEVGVDNFIEEDERGQTGLHLNYFLVEELKKGQKRLRFWHDHPQREFEKKFKDEWRSGKNKDSARKKYAYHSTYGSFPNGGDISAMVWQTYTHRKAYWNTHIWNKPTTEHCIRGEYGVMTFKLTKEGKKFYDFIGDFMGEEYMLWQSKERFGGDVARFLENEEINIESICPGQEIKELVETWDNEHMSLIFTPNEELGLELTRYEHFAEGLNKKILQDVF